MHRHLTCVIAAASIAALAQTSPALAGFDECDCALPGEFSVEPAPEADVTPRYIVNQGPHYSGPNLTAPPPTYADSPSAHPDDYPYVRSYYGWYFVGARY